MSVASKLSYLGETKEQIREGLNKLGGNISTSDTFRSYADKINEIYDSMPKVEETDVESATLDGTIKGGLTINPKGNTSQTGTPTPSTPISVNVVSGDNEVVVCGKNLTNVNQLTTRTINGIAITNNGDGSVTLNGTSTGEIALDFQIPVTTLINGNTYTFSKRTTIGSGLYALLFRTPSNQAIPNSVLNTNLDSSDEYKILTCNSNVEIGYMRLYIPNNKVITNHTIYPMLEKGSSMTTFEPYTSQTYEVDLPVENIFNINATPYQVGGNTTYSVNGNTLNVKGEWFIAYKINVSKNTDYYISANRERISGTAGEISIYDGSVQTQIANASMQNYTFNSGNNSTINIVLYAGSGTSGEANFTNIQLEPGTKANHYTEYNTTPIELCKIGDYQDYFTKNSGKNLFDKDNMNILNGYLYGNQMNISTARQDRILYIECKPNTTYTISRIVKTGSFRVATYNSTIPTMTSTATNYTCYNEVDNNSGDSITITTDGSSKYLLVHYGNVSSDSNIQDSVNTIMINEGSTALPYEPYGTGQWCKYNAIGKYTMPLLSNVVGIYDNSSSETQASKNGTFAIFTGTISNNISNNTMAYTIASYEYKSTINGNSTAQNNLSDNSFCMRQGTNDRIYFRCSSFTGKTGNQIAQEIQGTTLYYVLATPYLSLIEDNNLIEQLDELESATSYEGTTNIGQVNDDKAFIISVKAVKKGTNEVVVNNIGNVYSKPLIALEGSGNIDIYLDNTQILKANVEDKMNIDIAKLEAYNPDTSALLNRQVIGNYNTMTLQPGNNTIKIDGALDKATISNYTRWL